MHICLDIEPFTLTRSHRDAIAAAGATHIQILPQGSLNEFEGKTVDVLVSSTAPEHLDRWPRLGMIQLVSAGFDHLRDHPVSKSNIAIVSASGIHAPAMAEYATGALLMLSHQLSRAATYQADRKWNIRDDWYFQPRLLRGQTAGILGYGAIGREVARQLSSLGMRIVCLSRTPRSTMNDRFSFDPSIGDLTGEIPEQWFCPEQLSEMLPMCDVIVVTLPRTKATEGIIGKAELGIMKPTSKLIVLSRGGIVDEIAVAAALTNGSLAGAVFDAYATEPLASASPLFQAPNIIMTPHISGGFSGYWPALYRLFCENLMRHIKQMPLLNRVTL